MPAGAWKDGWFVVPYDVPLRDIDFYGHANNAIYFSWFEHARTLLWFNLTGGSRPEDVTFIVAHAQCDFRLQVELEPIEICVRVGEMRRTSFDTYYEVRKRGWAVAATGRVTVVLFDWARQSKVEISEELRRKVAECSRDAS